MEPQSKSGEQRAVELQNQSLQHPAKPQGCFQEFRVVESHQCCGSVQPEEVTGNGDLLNTCTGV